MHKAAIAEWMLRQLTSRERAAAMVGDLVEISAARGGFWFWFSMARLVLALAWRYPLAFFAALYSWTWALRGYEMALIGVSTLHRRPEVWSPFFTIVQALGAVLCGVAAHNAIRFGMRGRMTQIALLLAVICAIFVYGWWIPVVAAACGLPVLWLLGQIVRHKDWRRAAAALLLVFAVCFLGYIVAAFGDHLYLQFLHRGPWGSEQFAEHPSAAWSGFITCLFITWTMTTACSIAHRLAEPRMEIAAGSRGPGEPTAPSADN